MVPRNLFNLVKAVNVFLDGALLLAPFKFNFRQLKIWKWSHFAKKHVLTLTLQTNFKLVSMFFFSKIGSSMLTAKA